MNKKIQVFIDGAVGTTGMRLKDRLSTRSDIELLQISTELRKDTAERARISNSADVVFLCLPDDAAREAVQNITNPDTIVIDASTAHRILPNWTYGLPELSKEQREAIQSAKRIAVPGCHASGFITIAHPLIKTGAVSADYPFTVHSVTGYSGAGNAMVDRYADPNRPAAFSSPRQYALGQQHKHLPEMKAISGSAFEPIFNPIIADFHSGMAVTVPLHSRAMKKPMSAKDVHTLLADYYAGQKAVRVQPFGAESEFDGAMVDASALAGKDYMEIFVCGTDSQTIILARYDNLGKGASGAAIQCMNIACGLPEDLSLEF